MREKETWRERLRDGSGRPDGPNGSDMDLYMDELQRRIDAHPYDPKTDDANELTRKIQRALNVEIGGEFAPAPQ